MEQRPPPSPTDTPGPPVAELRLLLWGNMVTQALAVVAQLGVADALASGPLDATILATRVGANPDALHRVMRALASVGVFAETAPRMFGQTPLSDLLRDDARPSLRHMAILSGGDLYRAWAGAEASVRSGRSVFELTGTTHFDHLATQPEEQALFNKAMAGAARGFVARLLTVDFTGVGQVIDVGGGDGTLMIGLLEGCPTLRGGVFDLAHVVEAARANIAKAGLEHRCTCTGGSFFEQAPPEADAYVLSRVLHDWDDEHATAILRRCRSSIAASGRLIILDDIITDENRVGKFLDLQMLVVTGGRERTVPEWESLLQTTGFKPTSLRPGLIEARAC